MHIARLDILSLGLAWMPPTGQSTGGPEIHLGRAALCFYRRAGQ